MRKNMSVGRRGAALLAGVLTLAVLLALATPAMGQTAPSDEEQTLDIGGEVYKSKCTPCHGRIAESRSSEIIFSHGYHALIACSSCHSQFPHRPEGTQTPKMKECWYCHGLQHGPQGELATGKCDQCHRTPQERLRPSWHTPDWAEAPHVEPSLKNMRTSCMQCHDQAWCDDCHAAERVQWSATEPYTYDAEDGCYACHGNENLVKASAEGSHSFQVTGLDDSAHRDLTCQECHPDFKYETGLDATNLWAVNAGLACMECHDKAETREVVGDVAEPSIAQMFRDSIHGQELAEGNYESATCSSCHGGHLILRLNTDAAKRAFHQTGYRICARCHLQQWESFDDYYHGAAYKTGAADAPACWNCHGDHDAFPSGDPRSAMAGENKPATCGGSNSEGLRCHEGSTEEFVEAAGDLIHQQAATREDNPLRRFLSNIFGWLS